MSGPSCTSCCPGCRLERPSFAGTSSPFSLINLLPFGTLHLLVSANTQHLLCEHMHAEDGWHLFQEANLVPHLARSEDITFCQQLGFLVMHRFISATYMAGENEQMIVRIYLIPYDLANVRGELRIRKPNILVPAKKYMRDLLPRISQNTGLWNGQRDAGVRYFSQKDRRSLSDIYSNLPSPQAARIPGYEWITDRLLDFEDNLEGFGMRSSLYKYQRQSVAAMLQKELDLRPIPDPLHIPMNTLDGRVFYVQPGTAEVLLERPIVAPCRGGILCEELGTGKTIMMLSLIVATRSQISEPEPSIMDPDRPVLTPLAFRHFPSDEFSTARKRASSEFARTRKVPSLVELMLHRARTNPYTKISQCMPPEALGRIIAKEEEVSNLPLGVAIRNNVPFYHHYQGEPHNRERTQRQRGEPAPRTLFLTSATLIIVPANLLSQWDREIIKHCKLETPLRVLIVRAKTPLPSVQSLATDYDIILMSYTRFTSESSNQKVAKLHTGRPCRCPEMEGFRVPSCTCSIPGVSPFLQIRWKRLVIDEGHVSSTLSTSLVPFAKMMSVERRWIVTGTPTRNLLGLSLGSSVIESAENGDSMVVDSKDGDGSDKNILLESSEDNLTLHAARTVPPSPSSSSNKELDTEDKQEEAETGRVWTKYDREDLNKLGNMIAHFIAVPQFSADHKLISTHVTEPLLDRSGPRFGSIQVLSQVMEMVMIRHRIEDVEKDVVLPPVTQESILLDLDPYVRKSFNALQAGIIINAVDSQRTDQDYMFHPRNAEFLQDTVRNMSQILFWHVDDNLYNSKQLLESSEKHIQVAKERNMPQEDIDALLEAFRHLREASDDLLWRSMQTHEDVPYRISHLDEELFKAWTRTPHNELDAAPTQTGFLHADRLLKLYDMVSLKPLINQEKMIEWGHMVAFRDNVQRRAYEELQRKKNKRQKKSKHEDPTHSSQMADDFAKKASALDTLKEMQQELDVTMKRLAREEEEEDNTSVVPSTSQLGSPSKRPSMLISSSPLTKLRVGSSASSKLNYIINEVQKYSPTEKFLIFSESPLSLAHVAEALELIQVKFLRFTTQVTPQYREQLVLTFETSETYRVFLMELKHGARGLNLISASRVIFCEPVWQADVESQAIKRAHRIGQTKPISVKTLAIRDTAEENMVARKTALKNSQEKLPKVIEEAGMRHYIANPKFIDRELVPTRIEEFPLIQLPPEFTAPRPNALMLKIPAFPREKTSPTSKRIRVEDPISQSDVAEETPAKKKKVRSIRFASP
ncbi:hypothetical protein CPC08DRAFT_711560 [Agrocybe pediades]|nr:hypothetical protein CPC08DRAFT_711560 [Agrocybe pediades]